MEAAGIPAASPGRILIPNQSTPAAPAEGPAFG
jgi:hypothetical protein